MLMRPLLGLGILVWGLLALAVTPAQAQRAPGGDPETKAASEHVAGRFDYYTLVLSWSPTYCAGQPRPGDPQCNPRDGRRYAFVLHGLWPQYERGFPEYCRTRERPFVPQPTIDRMLDIMPSPQLVIHEFRRHGTCSGLDPGQYYDLSRRLFEKIKIPQRYVDPEKPFFVGSDELVQDFRAANPGLQSDMIGVECRGTGNRLREIRVCFSREGEFRSCGANETPRRLCRAARMYVPPVRIGTGPPNRRGRDADRFDPVPDRKGAPPLRAL
jgi:ribonuclease T2